MEDARLDSFCSGAKEARRGTVRTIAATIKKRWRPQRSSAHRIYIPSNIMNAVHAPETSASY
jgi:hypothetical protein